MSNFTFRIGETEDGKPVLMDLPTLIETRLFDLASSGGGKSYLLRVLIERTAGHVQWIVIDPEGEFASLREKFDFLLVGKDGEVPVNQRSARLLARKIMETRASVIVDLYEYKDTRVEWVADFLDTLMNLPKDLWSPVMLAIDEAHKFAPETVKGKAGEPPARAQRAVITLSDSGRKQSRGCVIATQRLQKLAVDARAELRNNMIGLTVQDLDRERAAKILGIKQNEILRELKAGEFFAFGPAFVSHHGVFRMKVDPALTRHPKPGEGRLLAVPKASDAVRALLGQMGDVPAQAQEETDALASAQKEIARLQHELRSKPVPIAPTPPQIQIVEKPVLNGELPQLQGLIGELRDALTPLTALPGTLKPLLDTLSTVGTKVDLVANAPKAQPRPMRADSSQIAVLTPPMFVPEVSPDAPPEGITASQQKILNVLETFNRLGIFEPFKSNVAVFAGASPKSSAFQNNLGRLRSLGLIEYVGDRMKFTAAGVRLAQPQGYYPTLAELHAAWFEKLARPQAAILRELIEAYPVSVHKDALAQRVGVSATSSAYQNNLGALRSLGIVDYPDKGYVKATALLFPDGLARD